MARVGATVPEEHWSQHPGLHALLDKLHRRVSLTDKELRQLQRLLGELEEHARPEQEESIRFEPAAPTASMKSLPGHATAEGGERVASRRGGDSVSFYRAVQDLVISSVGIGTYRGAMDNETDAAYAAAVHAALQSGVSLIDTSLNYRHQRSELSVAAGMHGFIDKGGGTRDEIVVCTKGGYLVPEAITPGTLGPDDVVCGTHAIAPAFLADQINRSRRNLGLDTIDVYYVHNPETQLRAVDKPEFLKRMRAAFEQLEGAVGDGAIRYYGTATWNGYRDGALSLAALADMAREVGGGHHHFRFVQLPFNMGMQESRRPVEGGASVLELAAELGITVIASAALLQSRLSRDLPRKIAALLPGLDTDAQRSIQFARSTPGIAAVLVGMSDTAHVAENLAVSRVRPLKAAEYRRVSSTLF